MGPTSSRRKRRYGTAAACEVTGQDAYCPGMRSVRSLMWRRRSAQLAPSLEPCGESGMGRVARWVSCGWARCRQGAGRQAALARMRSALVHTCSTQQRRQSGEASWRRL